MNPEERARRGTDEYLAGRRANGFGTQKRGAEHPNAKIASQLRKLLSEHLDEPIAPPGHAPLGSHRANLKAMALSRVEAALRVLDDAATNRFILAQRNAYSHTDLQGRSMAAARG